MLCLESSIKQIKKPDTYLKEQKIKYKNLDEMLEDLDVFESKTKDICCAIGFNAIRKFYDITYIRLGGISMIQDYVCKREKIDIVYDILKDLDYEEVENPFVIKVICENGKEEILNSSPEEKIFKKRNSDAYIAIFLENSIYYKVRGRKIIEEKIIMPKNAEIFTILYKIYRYNKKDFTDLIFLFLESGEVFSKINEDNLKEFILDYSRAAKINKKEIIKVLYKNLNNLMENINKIKTYTVLIHTMPRLSLEDYGIQFIEKSLYLYFSSLMLEKGDRPFENYKELERIRSIIEKLNNY